MPKVPTLAGPSVDARPLPTPYASADATPEAFGAGVADAVGDASQVAFNVYHRARQQADLALVQKQEAALREHANLALWGENGLHKQEGENALRASTGLYDTFEKRRAELESGLTDQKQKDAFNVAATNIRDTFRSQAEGWIAHQRQVLGQQSLKGTLATTKATIANGFTDPRTVDEGMTAIESNLRAYGAAHGVPPEEVTAQIGQHQAEAARSVIYGYLAPGRQDAGGAAVAYAQYKDKLGFLPENERHVLESAIGHTSTVQQADAKALDVVKQSMGPDGQVDRRKAQGLVDEMPAGPVKDETQKRVDHKSAVFDAAWKDEANDLSARVLEQMTNPEGRLDATLVNPATMDALRQKWPAKASQLEKAALVDQRRTGIEQSKARYMQALEDFTDEPEAFARMKPAEFDSTYRPLMDVTHFVLFKQRYDKLQRRVDVSPQEAAHVENVVLQETKKALGLGKAKRLSDLPDAKKAQIGDLVQSVNDRVKEWSVVNGGKPFPPPDELRKMVAEGMAKIPRTDEQRFVEAFPFTPKQAPDYQFQVEAQTRKVGDSATAAPVLPPDASDLAIPLPYVTPSGRPVPTGNTTAPLRAPSGEDLAAIDWLRTHANDPAAPGVRARLRSKGIE